MPLTKDWRPEDWTLIKENIIKETPVVFSPATGYQKDALDIYMEKAVSAAMGALAAVIVTGISDND